MAGSSRSVTHGHCCAIASWERVYARSPIKLLSPADRAALSAVLCEALGVSSSSELPLKHD